MRHHDFFYELFEGLLSKDPAATAANSKATVELYDGCLKLESKIYGLVRGKVSYEGIIAVTQVTIF
jgi:hypothetical protein